MKIAEKVKEFFHNEGIHSTTIQPEFVELEGLHCYTGKCGEHIDTRLKWELNSNIYFDRWNFNKFECKRFTGWLCT